MFSSCTTRARRSTSAPQLRQLRIAAPHPLVSCIGQHAVEPNDQVVPASAKREAQPAPRSLRVQQCVVDRRRYAVHPGSIAARKHEQRMRQVIRADLTAVPQPLKRLAIQKQVPHSNPTPPAPHRPSFRCRRCYSSTLLKLMPNATLPGDSRAPIWIIWLSRPQRPPCTASVQSARNRRRVHPASTRIISRYDTNVKLRRDSASCAGACGRDI